MVSDTFQGFPIPLAPMLLTIRSRHPRREAVATGPRRLTTRVDHTNHTTFRTSAPTLSARAPRPKTKYGTASRYKKIGPG